MFGTVTANKQHKNFKCARPPYYYCCKFKQNALSLPKQKRYNKILFINSPIHFNIYSTTSRIDVVEYTIILIYIYSKYSWQELTYYHK